MSLDYYVTISLWIFLPIILWIVVPHNRWREAIATLLFFQMLTWLFSIGLTFAGLLDSPVRIFKYATKISFTMEYLVFPSIAVFFQLTFPPAPRFIRRVFHYLLWVFIILISMFLIGLFTQLMVVKLDGLVRSFFNFIIELWLCRQYVLWIQHKSETKKVEYL